MASTRQTEFSFVPFIAETGKWRMRKGGGCRENSGARGGTFPEGHTYTLYFRWPPIVLDSFIMTAGGSPFPHPFFVDFGFCLVPHLCY